MPTQFSCRANRLLNRTLSQAGQHGHTIMPNQQKWCGMGGGGGRSVTRHGNVFCLRIEARDQSNSGQKARALRVLDNSRYAAIAPPSASPPGAPPRANSPLSALASRLSPTPHGGQRVRGQRPFLPLAGIRPHIHRPQASVVAPSKFDAAVWLIWPRRRVSGRFA